MRIICPTCASHYEVEREQIAASGQLVRCAECREVWLVECEAEPAPLPRPTPAPTVAPDRREGEPSGVQGVPPVPPPTPPIDFAAARTRLRRRGAETTATRARNGSVSLLSVAAILAASLAMLLGFRGPIAAEVPIAQPVYAALGLPVATDALALQAVHSAVVAGGDHGVLSLEGTIANLGDGPAQVPNLTVVVRDDGHLPLYSWTAAAPKTVLAKGETVIFRSRLEAPPAAAHDVRVSFADPILVP